MKIRIAVIEDNQMNIDLIRYQLKVEGFKVFNEKTGEKGLKMIKNQKPIQKSRFDCTKFRSKIRSITGRTSRIVLTL